MSSFISHKGIYAVRAVLELARHRHHKRPLRMADIAKAQDIPPRFLEAILNQLRHAEIIESVRGPVGGYLLAKPALKVSVGEVLFAVQGPLHSITQPDGSHKRVSFHVLNTLWSRAEAALTSVFDTTSFAQLLEDEEKAIGQGMLTYDI